MDRGMQMGEVGRVEPVASLPGAARLKELREKIVLVDALIHADDCKSKDAHSTRCKASGDVLGLFDALFPAALAAPEEASAEGSPSHPSSPSQDSAGFDAEGAYMTINEQMPIWSAINTYMEACGGSPSTTNVRRQRAVAMVNHEINQMLNRRLRIASPPQDSQEVRDAVAKAMREIATDWDMGNHYKPWKDLKEENRDWWRQKADRILALLSQSPKGAAGAGLEALEKEIVSAACLEYSTRNNGDYAPRRALHEAVRAYLAAPSPTTAGALQAAAADLAHRIEEIGAGEDGPSAPKTGLRGAGAPGSYRKRPVMIQAFRMGIDPRPDWFTEKVTKNEIITREAPGETYNGPFGFTKTCCEIQTLEGVMRGEYGDWIIRGVKGEVYPCKPDIFATTYEPAPGDVGEAGGDKA